MNANSLPLAEKTNIKNWAFEDLVLKDVSNASLSDLDILPTDNQLILVDGIIVHNTVPADLVIVSDVSSLSIPATNKLLDLNHQKNNSILGISVPKNLSIKETISVVVVARKRSLVHQTHVVLENSSELKIVENYVGLGNFNGNIVSEFKVGANANLTVNTVNDMHEGCVVYHHKSAEVEQDGVLDATNFIINDTDLVFEDFAYLVGRGAQANVKTVSIASGAQKQNMTVRTENIAPNTVGNIVNYGIVKDDAHLAFNGIGKIQKASKASDNQQETRLLNLSKTAQAVANPFLLIDEGDITAGHAASIGQLDEEQIYYLMSRGMSRTQASKMIVSGFLTPFVDAIDDETMKEALRTKIETKLG